jgi:hypothetical protein
MSLENCVIGIVTGTVGFIGAYCGVVELFEARTIKRQCLNLGVVGASVYVLQLSAKFYDMD